MEPYPLAAHLLDTFAVAEGLWDVWLAPHLRRLLVSELGRSGDFGSQPVEAFAKAWSCFNASIHDVGKAGPGFQMLEGSRKAGQGWRSVMSERLVEVGLPELPKDTREALAGQGVVARRHEFVGMVSLRQALSGGEIRAAGAGPVSRLRLDEEWVAAVVGGHHGKWIVPGVQDLSMSFVSDWLPSQWVAAQSHLVEVVREAAGLTGYSVPVLDPSRAGVVVTLLTGFTILADWIASSDQVVEAGYQHIAAGANPHAASWAAFRRDELRDVVKRTVGSYVQLSDPVETILGVDSAGVARVPWPLQRDALSVGDGAWFVAYPTAEGKTEAALLRHAAGEPEGLIFGLPTRATTDEMQRRLALRFAETGNTVVLSHRFAAAHRVECASEYGLEWFSSSIRRLMAPVVAATCDQVLVGSLRQRHSALRLLALANHHVVLDEVHTYDQYQSHLLKNLMTWWGATGTRVTLLSATLPAWQQRDFARAYAPGAEVPPTTTYPAHWVVTDAWGPAQTPELSSQIPPLAVDLKWSDDATGTHVEWVLRSRETSPRGHTAVIRSTVSDTIETARRLREAVGEDDSVQVVCLHSRMTVAHRTKVQKELEGRLGPERLPGPALIVVASQVIEAALDYDFDLMSTDLAPAAALIQRAGRLWRFVDLDRWDRLGKRVERRNLHVVARTQDGCINRASALPYLAPELERVAQWLTGMDIIRIPQDVQAFVDETSLDLESAATGSETDPEIAACAVMLSEAARAASCLGQRIARPARRTRYQDLCDLTGGEGAGGPQDADRMGTRFTERESFSFILLGGPFGTAVTREELARTKDDEVIRDALDAIVSTSDWTLIRRMNSVVRQNKWEPKTRILMSSPPVHVDDLSDVGVAYDADDGLITNTTTQVANGS